ncbi:MAG: hypothetical protein QM535_20065 [Limnohabitans sp.]|nr:hypothetical protein [Limnohabitans sp.]
MNNNGCALIALLVIGYIIVWIGSGIYAWDWVRPESFLGAIGFLIVWAIVGRIFFLIGGFIVTLIIHIFS